MNGSEVKQRIVLLTGLSGAGKSCAGRALEDGGYTCVDNLPIPLIPQLLETLAGREKIVISVDARARRYLDEFPAIWQKIKRING